MGGGTGTGAAPIIAKCARERGILTVGVVTKPFQFEGRHRMRLADAGISELQRYVDTLIVIPNQNLFRIANEKTTFAEAFGMADQVLHSGVRSITDLMVLPGLINLDFADVRTVMTEMGKAMMGTGEAMGEDRALMAAQNAIANPLLDEISLKGAKAVLVNVTGGLDMTLLEVDEAANAISAEVDPDANIIFGAAFDPSLDGKIRVSVVATGMDGSSKSAMEPATLRAGGSAPRRLSDAGLTRAPEPLAQFEPAAMTASATSEDPELFETLPVAASLSDDGWSFDAPVELAPEPAPVAAIQPDLIDSDLYEPRAEVTSRSFTDADAAEEPLFPEVRDDRRPQQKGGWLSLFGGRQRYENAPASTPAAPAPREPARDSRPSAPAPVGQARTGASAQLAEEPRGDEGEDLNIPSFLRRLAN
jgi:cell division protein FtsZ